MSDRKWTYRIRHMLESIKEIKTYTTGMTMQDFVRNQQTQRAVERCFEIMGEAAIKMPDLVTQKYPEIPWPKIKGMRNFVIHEYDKVLEEVLWNTIQNDIDDLEQKLLAIELPEGE